MRPSYAVHVSGRGNVYLREMAELLRATLVDIGRDAELVVDKLPQPTPGQVDLVVAPHELFTLLDGVSEAEKRHAAAGAVCVGTEQPGTEWFQTSARYMAQGPIALDINPLAVAALRRLRVPARRLALGYHRSWDRWDGRRDVERPTDILFLGAATPHREAVIARNATALAERECDLRFFEASQPALGGAPGFLVGDRKREQLATTKVLLNIHRGEVPYFEWVRALEAITNGAVFVTERSNGTEPLEAGVHYVAADGDDVVTEALELLADPGRRERIAADAHRLVRERLDFGDLLSRCLDDVEEAVARNRGRELRSVVPRLATADVATKATSLYRDLRHAVALRVRGITIAEIHEVHRDLGQQIKALTFASRRLTRRLEASESRAQFGDPQHVELEPNAAWEAARAEVSVVLPLYNYAHVVAHAIASVAASTDVSVELIVVDDHSTDGSRETARAELAAHPELPSLLAGKAANAGLSAARNTGFQLARADKVFLLDADNEVLPAGLRRLATALDASDAAFAYGIIARWGDEDSLVSHLPWDVARLCEGNYIDAMALVRRSAWDEAGGYDLSLERLHGWEDYELWLHLAALQLRGELVAQPVATYWRHGDSMLSLTNLETASVRAELRARYPDLPWPASAE
ncbi:MAG: glycosyltransferase [Acidimicrobiales bacterium]